MNLLEKRDLVRLLNKYQEEILAKLNLTGKLEHGQKSQYDHARIMSQKLSAEISEELTSHIYY